ncbi:uncharacterized protein MAM_06393 [Metarhizium album ARSEF 1941]|uniref:Uncharacterized protein n=1 Tax=Metarhizium album (strain ARSEF 1941) TaxID=1081103 RepID=A0A0B2WID4_METAS|nr:uncharacterized protein MAM_06393 [Metarhizium album ARSEF 1941]KHN95781.1 hypothetical protein MAM_06393 [Metarhizium album ARSEF 1941]
MRFSLAAALALPAAQMGLAAPVPQFPGLPFGGGLPGLAPSPGTNSGLASTGSATSAPGSCPGAGNLGLELATDHIKYTANPQSALEPIPCDNSVIRDSHRSAHALLAGPA